MDVQPNVLVMSIMWSGRRHRLNTRATVLWAGNILLAGIFGLWVLLWPAAFLKVATTYCRIPASFCTL